MKRQSFESVKAYIAAQPPASRPALARVRTTIQKALPGASEAISYQIPVYKLDGVMVLYFAGFARHYSIYPITPHVMAALKQELKGLLHGRATVRFPLTGAVPARLITRIAKLRAEEATELLRAKAAKKTSKKAAPSARTKVAERVEKRKRK